MARTKQKRNTNILKQRERATIKARFFVSAKARAGQHHNQNTQSNKTQAKQPEKVKALQFIKPRANNQKQGQKQSENTKRNQTHRQHQQRKQEKSTKPPPRDQDTDHQPSHNPERQVVAVIVIVIVGSMYIVVCVG